MVGLARSVLVLLYLEKSVNNRAIHLGGGGVVVSLKISLLEDVLNLATCLCLQKVVLPPRMLIRIWPCTVNEWHQPSCKLANSHPEGTGFTSS